MKYYFPEQMFYVFYRKKSFMSEQINYICTFNCLTTIIIIGLLYGILRWQYKYMSAYYTQLFQIGISHSEYKNISTR